MFDKKEFSRVIKQIQSQYNSQEEFSKKSGIGRTYISQYINMKKEKPPKPEILEKLSFSADSDNYGEATYERLLWICGYIDYIGKEEEESLEKFKENIEILQKKLTKTELLSLLEIVKTALEDLHDLNYNNYLNLQIAGFEKLMGEYIFNNDAIREKIYILNEKIKDIRKQKF